MTEKFEKDMKKQNLSPYCIIQHIFNLTAKFYFPQT